MAGVTSTGFGLKRLLDILNDMVAELSTVQDPVSGEHLTPSLSDENDPLVQIVNATADQLSVCWQEIQLAYNQFDPLKATGAALSGLVQLNGILRNAGSPSTVTVSVTGTPGTVIPANSQITTTANNGPVFTIPSVTIPGGGTITALATCTVDGPSAALAGTLVKILTPVSGWASVTNAADATLGVYEESDSALRARQQISTEYTGKSTVEDLYAELLNLAGVTFLKIYQNVTSATDARGLPAKSLATVIVGGVNADIAEQIHNHVALGVETYGTTTVNITDLIGVTYPIKFSRPAEVNIYIAIEYSIVQLDVWPSDGETRVKAAIVAWAEAGGSAIGINSGFDQDGIPPGASVYASDFYVPIMSVPGIQIKSVKIGIAPAPTGDSVTIAWNQWAKFATARIGMTVI